MTTWPGSRPRAGSAPPGSPGAALHDPEKSRYLLIMRAGIPVSVEGVEARGWVRMSRAVVRAVGLSLVMASSMAAPASGQATESGPTPATEPAQVQVRAFDLGNYRVPEGGARRAADSLTFRREVDGFSAYTVSWTGSSPPRGIAGRVRRHGAWSGWQALDLDETARPAHRVGAGLVWAGPSDGVELTVTGGAPRELRLELIDPGDRPSDHVPAPEATPGQPAIVSRADWGADESKMTWKPEYADTLSAIVLHHTATSGDYQPEDVPKIMRSIYHYQAVTLEWGDIGYHVVVDRFGRLWEGRTGGLRKPVIGAHAGGFNVRTAGISMIGTFTETTVPDAVIDAAARYVAWRFAPYGVDPGGSTRLTGGPNTKYDKKVTVTVPRVYPHRQTNATECPGDQGVAALPAIRDAAYRYGE